MQRMVACVPPYQVTGRLVSAPPSQRTSTPLERCWGLVATHWHGALREAIAIGLQWAASMTWQGTPPLVPRVTPPYPTGVTWTTEAMEAVEANLKRLPHLPKWFVDIVPASPPLWAPELFLSPLEEFTASPSSFVSHEICICAPPVRAAPAERGHIVQRERLCRWKEGFRGDPQGAR